MKGNGILLIVLFVLMWATFELKKQSLAPCHKLNKCKQKTSFKLSLKLKKNKVQFYQNFDLQLILCQVYMTDDSGF